MTDKDYKVHVISFYDNKLNTELGDFFPDVKVNTSLQKEIYSITQSFDSPKGISECQTLKNNKIYWRLSRNQVVIFIVCTNNISSDNIDSLLEEIENQNIVKYLDKQKNLNNVARQNLQYLLDKHLDNKSSSMTKIGSIKDDINTMKGQMVKNIKSISSNIEDSKVLDERAAKIKDSSILFSQNSSDLLRISKMRRWRNLAIIIGISFFVILLIYLMFF